MDGAAALPLQAADSAPESPQNRPTLLYFLGTLVPDLGCFPAELEAHKDLVQSAVWSRDGALVGTACKVSREQAA